MVLLVPAELYCGLLARIGPAPGAPSWRVNTFRWARFLRAIDDGAGHAADGRISMMVLVRAAVDPPEICTSSCYRYVVATPHPPRARLECATHELISVIGDRWSVLVLIELGDRGATRSADLKRAVDGVSQKVLTTCLRRLEGRGFVARTVEATVPASVTYDLTTFGRSFFDAFGVLRAWADDHVDQLDATRTPR